MRRPWRRGDEVDRRCEERPGGKLSLLVFRIGSTPEGRMPGALRCLRCTGFLTLPSAAWEDRKKRPFARFPGRAENAPIYTEKGA